MVNTNTSATGGFLAPLSGLPVEDQALDVVLQNMAAGILELPPSNVRPRWQPIAPQAPGPDVDWCAIGVHEEEAESQTIATVHDGAGEGSSTTQDHDELLVLVSLYGPNARQNEVRLRHGVMVDQNRDTLDAAGLKLAYKPRKGTFVPYLFNQQTQRRIDVFLHFRRRVEMTWAIKNLLQMQGTIHTATHAFDEPLLTPHSVNPLVE